MKCILHSDAGDMLPRASFSQSRLYHSKEGTGFLYCTGCEERLGRLKGQVEKTKYKCTCKKSTHNPSDEKCPLFALRGNWPGKDYHKRDARVTKDDVRFLNRLPRHNRPSSWWYRLLGQL